MSRLLAKLILAVLLGLLLWASCACDDCLTTQAEQCEKRGGKPFWLHGDYIGCEGGTP